MYAEPAEGSFNLELHRELRSMIDAPPAEEWDTSWTKKITGKHRAVFDSPAVDGGVGVFRSGLWLKQYADVLEAAPADLNSAATVGILRDDAGTGEWLHLRAGIVTSTVNVELRLR